MRSHRRLAPALVVIVVASTLGWSRPDGAAADAATCQGRPATQVVTPSDGDDVSGTAGDDVVVVEGDHLGLRYDSLDGDDLICLTGSAESVRGGPGDDHIIERGTAPRGTEIDGDDGADNLQAGTAPSRGTDEYVGVLDGGAGDDRLVGGDGADLLVSGPGDDTIDGGAGRDEWSLGGADDTDVVVPVDIDVPHRSITGQGTDRLVGVEDFQGSPASDRFEGGPAAETFFGLGGDDRVWSGSGDDVVNVEDGSSVEAGPGSDDLVLGGHTTGRAGSGDDRLTLDEDATGYGDKGDDLVTDYGAAGRRHVFGGPGAHDEFFVQGGVSLDRVMVDAGRGRAIDDRGAVVALAGFEVYRARARRAALLGTSGPDRLLGGGGDDVLRGRQGHDVLEGDTGDDLLVGGSGDDRLVGGGGTDDARGDSGRDVCQAERKSSCEA